MVFLSAWKFTKLMLPVGKFGIKKISQTPLYNNFGMLGVTGVVSILVLASYTEWRTLRFTLDKFYRHIILQQRNWLQINAEHSIYCNYEYKDSPLSN